MVSVIVTVVLTSEGKLDVEISKQLATVAGTMQLTFHRAFDRTADPLEAL